MHIVLTKKGNGNKKENVQFATLRYNFKNWWAQL